MTPRITKLNSLLAPKKSPSCSAASSATTSDMSHIPRKAKAAAMLRYSAHCGGAAIQEMSAGTAGRTI